ncbi:hypothetical protein NSPZN2_150004 [Nitrospira defluvii]|uniref:Uncharacterized protein n=1 Tax=Nitrospira defluvii TaxID=330214 RepID=A0ABM8RA55_9BACT|nr:hypothetical protein NSPZN2_150004 [Nitrospira defluvii]
MTVQRRGTRLAVILTRYGVWSEHTTGPVSVETVDGDHMDAVHSIHAHQHIGEALAAIEPARS